MDTSHLLKYIFSYQGICHLGQLSLEGMKVLMLYYFSL